MHSSVRIILKCSAQLNTNALGKNPPEIRSINVLAKIAEHVQPIYAGIGSTTNNTRCNLIVLQTTTFLIFPILSDTFVSCYASSSQGGSFGRIHKRQLNYKHWNLSNYVSALSSKPERFTTVHFLHCSTGYLGCRSQPLRAVIDECAHHSISDILFLLGNITRTYLKIYRYNHNVKPIFFLKLHVMSMYVIRTTKSLTYCRCVACRW